MREIKFRAWDGRTMQQNVGVYPASGSLRFGANGGHMFYRQNEANLMQYTGLKDKNGKEIYEGDILQLKNTKGQICNHQEVYYDGETASFGWRTANDDSWPDGFSGFYDEYEVVGNIYENPELL